MINPEYELLDSGEADSTEVGRIVPIYEAIGGVTSRIMRRIIYAALQNLGGDLPDPLPAELLDRYKFPSRGDALQSIHLPPRLASVGQRNSLSAKAHQHLS